MARIRSIKPEFFTDEKITECSLSARLLFIGTWVHADDSGNLDRSAKQLKARVFPADEGVDCEEMVQELIAQGLLTEYSVSGHVYLHIQGFAKHQKINRPSAPRCPPFDESLIVQGVVSDGSVRAHRGKRKGGGREVDEEGDLASLREAVVSSLPPTKPLSADALESARASAEKPVEEPDPIFGAGLAFLVGKGVKERAARGFLGLLRKEVGDLVSGELLARAEADDVSDPCGWLRAAAQRRGKGNGAAGAPGHGPMPKERSCSICGKSGSVVSLVFTQGGDRCMEHYGVEAARA